MQRVGGLFCKIGLPSAKAVFGKLQILDETRAGQIKIWKGQTSNSMGQIVSFRLIDPPPPNLEVGRFVKMTGIFMKRYAYLNRHAGEKLTWTPLIYVRSLEPQVETDPSAGSNSMTKITSIGISILVTLGLLAYFYGRMQEKTVRGNYFTRLKQERSGKPQGKFPRPGAKR